MRRLVHLLGAGALAFAVTSCSRDEVVTTDATAVGRAAAAAAPTATSTSAPASAVVAPPSSTTSAPTTSTPATAPPTTAAPTTAPSLPTPIAPPPEDGTSEETFEVGTLEIPRTGLRAAFYEGIRLSTLDRGPGHWPGTAMPGDPGNVVLAGHRTSHNAEFRRLDELAPGDEVIMHTLAGRFVYRVASTEIVPPEALWIIDQTPDRTATLFACHPPGSVRERIVVRMELDA